MKTITATICLVIGLVFCVLTGCWLESKEPKPDNGFYKVDSQWKVSGSIENAQRFLKSLNNPRYDPGPIDNDPGPKFRKAYTNYCKDIKASRMFKKMQRERK